MKLQEYPDREMMMIDLANRIAGELNTHLMAEGGATLAVAGGTTPGPMFDALCAATLPWEKVRVMPTDERWVPEDSPRSNARLIRKRLLTDRAAAATFLPLHNGAETPEEGLEAITATLEGALPISVLVLGMGEDMHVASLFPGAPELVDALDAQAPPLLPVRPADQPEARVTLTGPVLRQALSVHILITGAGKRAALDRARQAGDPMEAPVLTVLGDAMVHWAE